MQEQEQGQEKGGYVVPEFTGENIPVEIAASILGKEGQFVRQGMIQGILPIGTVLRKNGSKRYNYYISPRLFWEYSGYVYQGKEVEEARMKERKNKK